MYIAINPYNCVRNLQAFTFGNESFFSEALDFEKLKVDLKSFKDLVKQVNELKAENRHLKQRLQRDEEKLDEIAHEKADLALALECDEDRIFNLSSSNDAQHISGRKRSTSVQAMQSIPLILSSPKDSPSPSRSRTKSAGPFNVVHGGAASSSAFLNGNHHQSKGRIDASPVRSLYGKNWFAKRSQSLSDHPSNHQ